MRNPKQFSSILVISKDKHLPKHLTVLGPVSTMNDITKVVTINPENYDLVVLGPPYKKENASLIPHDNIKLITEPEDLEETLRELGITKQAETKKQRQVRSQPIDNIPYNEVRETILVVSSDLKLIKTLSCFNILIATNKYSAIRHLEDITKVISLIVWDTNTVLDKMPKTKIQSVVWGKGVKSTKDIYLLLTTGRISINNKNRKE